MAKQNELAGMTLKELRQLAGQHQIKNRSRLAKKDLIEALSQAAAAGERPAQKPPAAKPPPPPKTDTPVSQTAPADEPEVLDAAAVARITGGAADEPAPRKHEEPAASQRAPRQERPAAGQDQREADTKGADKDADKGKDKDDDSTDEEGGRSKRRRSRRRRKRGKGNGDKTNGERNSGEKPENDDRQESDKGGKDRSDVGKDRSDGGKDRSDRREAGKADKGGKGRETSERPAQESAPAKPRRPRLDKPQRKAPPILDRLRAFSRGILELCDPDTPSWAQPRLSELLAEAGVAPIPCEGLPHPDFHEVVGERGAAGVQPGHISAVENPGFALRGDRGDLFPLRRSQVLVAPGGRESGEREQSRNIPDEPTRTEPEPTTEPASEPEAQGAQAEPVASQAPAKPVAAERPASTDEAPAPAPASEESPPARKSRSRRRKPADEDQPPAATGPVEGEPAPAPTDSAHRAMPGDQAPTLPLRPQDPDELELRPKSQAFQELGLCPQILADLAEIGYEQPSPIQAEGIPPVLQGHDIIGQAQTGTGKTAAFVLPLLHRLYEWEGEGPVALILCPTRELARQGYREFNRMAGKSGARTALIYGGVSMDDQLDALARKPHAIIGTPGRIIDHMRRRNLDLSHLKMMVLDEADQMLDIGFLPDIEFILKHTPPQRQTLLFSATMPEEIRRLSERYMREPRVVHVLPERVTADNVDQKWIAVDSDRKTRLLAHFIETQDPEKMVVFCRTKHQTDRVADVLKRKKIKAGAIHGDLPQKKRERTLKDFADGKLPCLIATNVAARGLDIPALSHVVNYDIPENPEEYVHRIGRTARMGGKGVARTFITPDDGQFLLEIEKHIGELLEEEVVDGMQATTTQKTPSPEARERDSAQTPRLLKPLAGGVRLGRRRR